MRYIVKHIILFSILISASGCSFFQRQDISIIDILPRDTDVPGWTRTAEPGIYTDDDIQRYNADYAGIGLQSMAVCSYSYIDDRERIMRVEAMRFNTVLNSYSFFSRVNGFGETIPCPEDEFYTQGASVFRAGEYIVFVTITGENLNNIRDMKVFLDAAREYIGDNYSKDQLPPVYNLLKRTGASCVLYSRRGIEPIPGLNSVYYASVKDNDTSYGVFLSDRGTGYESLDLFNKITGKKYIIMRADDSGSAFIKDRNGLYTFISVYDRWIFGCWGVSDINYGKVVLTNLRNIIDSHMKAEK